MPNLTESLWNMNKRFLFTKLKLVTLIFNCQLSDQKQPLTNPDLKNLKENQLSVQDHHKSKANFKQNWQLNNSEH